jgi:hypothetical protein
MNTYSCDATKIKYKKHHRGVDAVAVILKDNKPFATLYDEAIAISAKVEFVDKLSFNEFAADAFSAGYTHESVTFNVSEYARKIVADAEDALLVSQGE